MDHDLRRPFPNPSSKPPPSAAPSSSQATMPMDTDFRRAGPSREQFPLEGDLDLRHGSSGLGGFPPQGPPRSETQEQEMYEDSDMRSQQYSYGPGQEGRGYKEDQYREPYIDYDARVPPGGGGDVDERYPPHEMGHGGYHGHGDMHSYQGGYQDNHGGPGRSAEENVYEEDPPGRKRSWQDGPGGGGRGGRGQDPRRGGGFGKERDSQQGRGRNVYNGPAGPIDPRRGGMRGGRGRGGRGRGGRGQGGRGGWWNQAPRMGKKSNWNCWKRW